MLILSRHHALVATSVVVSVLVAGALSGCDMSQVKLVSRHLDLVATSFLFVFDVATAWSCRDPLVLAAVVATTRCYRDPCFLFMLSRLLHDVATSSLCN